MFAMANPTPEVLPSDIDGAAAIVATGRSDYPNQINNVLAFPGMFRGALDVRASEVTTEMELAAAHAIAAVIPPDELALDYVVPSVFNRAVAPAVAKAVAEAAEQAGVARKRPSRRAGRELVAQSHKSTRLEPMSETPPEPPSGPAPEPQPEPAPDAAARDRSRPKPHAPCCAAAATTA